MNRKIQFFASLGWVNDERKEVVDMVDDAGRDDWDSMSEAEQDKACEQYFNESFLPNYLDAGWGEVAP